VSVHEIQARLEELYQVEIAPSAISAITDEVMAEVQAWQQRPLDRMYPVVIFDALRVKIRDEGTVRNKAVYLALVDGLVGFPDAITTIFPQAKVHHCVVHLVQQSLAFTSWKAAMPFLALLLRDRFTVHA
jgi:transposase-like protein